MSSFTLQKYSTERYSTLCSVEQVAEEFEQANGHDSLEILGAIIIKHGLADLWGLQLIHNHFNLDDSERLVSFGAVAVPLKLEDITPEKVDEIRPVSWILDSTGAIPYEYARLPTSDGYDEDTVTSFLGELSTALNELKLSHLLGAVYLPGTALGFEYTDGKANITIPNGFYAKKPGNSIQVLWTFQDSLGKKSCSKICVSSPNGHRKQHTVDPGNTDKLKVRGVARITSGTE